MKYILLFIVIVFFIYKRIVCYKEDFRLDKFLSNVVNPSSSNETKNKEVSNNLETAVQPLIPIYMPENSIIDKNDINVIDLKPFYNEKINNDINNSINNVNKIYFSNNYLNNISRNIDIKDKKILR